MIEFIEELPYGKFTEEEKEFIEKEVGDFPCNTFVIKYADSFSFEFRFNLGGANFRQDVIVTREMFYDFFYGEVSFIRKTFLWRTEDSLINVLKSVNRYIEDFKQIKEGDRK